MFLHTLIKTTEAYKIQPDIFQQTDHKPVTQITQPKQNQNIVFKEIGKMKYIHVIVPLNISVLYMEDDILRKSLHQKQNNFRKMQNSVH